MKQKLVIALFCVAFAATAYAQQDPIYAQYQNNPLVINPAFTAINEKFNAGIQYRTQWAGLAGNPVSWNAYSNISLANNKVGAGLLIIEDRIGDSKNSEFNATYSYKMQFGESLFSFGLQMGFMRFTNDPSKINLMHADDPNFTFFNEMKFNTGVGMLLKNDRFLLGISVPRLLPGKIDVEGAAIQVYERNFYVMGSYQIFLTERVRLRPGALLRTSRGSGPSIDANMNVNIENRYTLGAFTRNLNQYGLLLQMKFKHYNVGYVVEIPASQSSALNFVSHEITFSTALPVLGSHNRSDDTY